MKKRDLQFVIRDDDLNYFSSPADIQRWYSEVFAMNIPVVFSAIPFVKPTCDAWLPRPLPDNDNEYPISNNKELIDYVKNNQLIEIVLHGCTHETIAGVFEYQKESGLMDDTLRGKQEIENAFGKPISVFVAPHDQISNHGIICIEHAGLNLIRGKGTKNIIFRIQYFTAIFKMILHVIRFFGLHPARRAAYPYVINLGKHKEAFACRIEMDINDLKRSIQYAYNCNGVFILTNHIHDFSEEKKEIMLELIQYAKSLGAGFVTAENIFK